MPRKKPSIASVIYTRAIHSVPKTEAAARRAGLTQIQIDFEKMSDSEAQHWLHIGDGIGSRGSLASIRKRVTSSELEEFAISASAVEFSTQDRTVTPISQGWYYVCYHDTAGAMHCYYATQEQLKKSAQ